MKKSSNLRKLSDACQSGNLGAVKEYFPLVSAKLVNTMEKPHTSPPLLLAIYGGHIPVVSYLLDQPMVDINAQDRFNTSARIAAIEAPNSVEMVTFLLDHVRFQRQQIDYQHHNGITMLGHACVRGNIEVAKLCLARGANAKLMQVYLGDSGELGESCLHLAVQSGNLELAKMIVSAGVPFDVTDCNMRTVIFSAIKYSMLNMLKWLVEMGADLNWIDLVGLTPRDYADSIGMHQLAIYLARNGAQTQRSALRRPRGFVAQWTRLWVYGDLPDERQQPQVLRIGPYVSISGGWTASENGFDATEAFRLDINSIRATSLKTLLEPALRPTALSTTKIGSNLKAYQHFSPTTTATCPLQSSTLEANHMDMNNGMETERGQSKWRVTCTAPEKSGSRYSCVFFEQPYNVKSGTVAYFEVKIIKTSDTGVVAVGMVPEDFQYETNLPGWTDHSYAYHSDDGTCFTHTDSVPWGPAAFEGDTIGVGIHWDHGSVFFTHNGVFLGSIYMKRIGQNPLYGCIGIVGHGTTAEVNFGTEDLSLKLNSLQKHPFLFNFEVMAIKCEKIMPKIAAITGSLHERQVILLHEFPRLAVPLGPYIISIDPLELYLFFCDLRTGDLSRIPYESESPFNQNTQLLQIAFSGDKFYCIDVLPDHAFDPDNPGFELSEATIEAVMVNIFDLSTRKWSSAMVTLSHFSEKPLLEVASAHLPLENNKIWFLNSPNCPFYIDILQWRAFKFASTKLHANPTSIRANSAQVLPEDTLSLWQAGAAFARIPNDAQLTNDIIEFSKKSAAASLQTSISAYDTEPWNNEDAVKRALEAIKPYLQKWNGHMDMREQMQQYRPVLPAITVIDTWKPKLAGKNAEYEYELVDEGMDDIEESQKMDVADEAHESHCEADNQKESQLLVFGGMTKVSKAAAERAHNRVLNAGDDVPSISDVYSKGQLLFTSDLCLFNPQSRTWTIPRVRGFLPTPKGQSGMVYIGGGRILNFGGTSAAPNMPMEVEMVTLNLSISTDDKLSIFLNNDLFSDFDIIFPSLDGSSPEIFKAHKAVLIARSQFFQNLLSLPLPSTLISTKTGAHSDAPNQLQTTFNMDQSVSKFEVPAAEVQFLRFMLRYLYSDTVPSDLQPDDYCKFLDFVELHFKEHLPRLSELLLLNGLTSDSNSILSAMGSLLVDPAGLALADVQVLVDGGDPILCHKVILCARSDYFKALFGGSMIEGQKGVATIKDIPYKVCLEIVRYLYTLTLNLDAIEEVVVDVLIWSNALSILDLYSSLESVVISSLSVDNVDYLLDIAMVHNLSNLAAECDRFKHFPTELIAKQVEDVDLERNVPGPKRPQKFEILDMLDQCDEQDIQPVDGESEGVRKAKEVLRSIYDFATNAAGEALQQQLEEDPDPQTMRQLELLARVNAILPPRLQDPHFQRHAEENGEGENGEEENGEEENGEEENGEEENGEEENGEEEKDEEEEPEKGNKKRRRPL